MNQDLLRESPSRAPVTSTGVWSTLREAVRGSRIDYTTAPVGRAVIMLHPRRRRGPDNDDNPEL